MIWYTLSILMNWIKYKLAERTKCWLIEQKSAVGGEASDLEWEKAVSGGSCFPIPPLNIITWCQFHPKAGSCRGYVLAVRAVEAKSWSSSISRQHASAPLFQARILSMSLIGTAHIPWLIPNYLLWPGKWFYQLVYTSQDACLKLGNHFLRRTQIMWRTGRY